MTLKHAARPAAASRSVSFRALNSRSTSSTPGCRAPAAALSPGLSAAGAHGDTWPESVHTPPELTAASHRLSALCLLELRTSSTGVLAWPGRRLLTSGGIVCRFKELCAQCCAKRCPGLLLNTVQAAYPKTTSLSSSVKLSCQRCKTEPPTMQASGREGACCLRPADVQDVPCGDSNPGDGPWGTCEALCAGPSAICPVTVTHGWSRP